MSDGLLVGWKEIAAALNRCDRSIKRDIASGKLPAPRMLSRQTPIMTQNELLEAIGRLPRWEPTCQGREAE